MSQRSKMGECVSCGHEDELDREYICNPCKEEDLIAEEEE